MKGVRRSPKGYVPMAQVQDGNIGYKFPNNINAMDSPEPNMAKYLSRI